MKTYASLAVAVLTVAALLSEVRAQNTVYWDINGTDPGAGQDMDGFTDGNWGTDPFWNPLADGTGATGAWVAGDHAVFSAGDDAVDHFIDVTGTQIAASLLIEDGLVTLNSGTVDTGAGTVTINDGATLSINSTLRLNTGAGKVVLNGGTLMQINPGQAGTFLGTGTNGTTGDGGGLKGLEVNGIGYIGYDDGDDIADNKVSIFSGVITGTGGTVENGGAGTLVKIGPDQIGIGVSDQDFTPGDPRIHSQSLFTFAKLVVEEGAYRLRNQTQDGTVKDTAFGAVPLAELADAITLDGGGIGTNTSVTLHANRGVTIGPNGGYLDHGAGAGLSIPGPISGSGTFTIGSASHVGGSAPNPTFTLSNANNANTFTGKLTILRGTLSVPTASALGAAPGSPVADSITISGAVATAGGSSTLVFTETTTLDANRGITLEGTTDGRINIPSGGNTLTYDGVITGPGKFIKMGDGTLTTAGAHTYEGGTDVYGRLTVNGSLSGAGPVAVKTTATGLGTNGTLGGTGSVAGLVTVEAMGAIAPGDEGIGTLTLAGGLTLGADSILNLELGSPTTGDLIDVTGGVTTLDGGTVNIADVGGLGDGTYTLIDYTGTLGGSVANLALGTTPAGFTFGLVDSGSTIDLMVSGGAVLIGDHNNDGFVNAADYVFWRDQMSDDIQGYNDWRANFGDSAGSGSVAGAAVPEPASLALAGLALAGLLGLRRKR